jgi:TPR repeat protein
MSESDNFALVRKPLSAVEKAAPGGKLILSGMVEDALALLRKTRPRIVVVDDEPMLLELFKVAILQCFKNATVLSFGDGDQAWQELSHADPDLLITDMNRIGLNGWKMLPLLADRKITFPILVASGYATEKDVRQCVGTDLNFSFLAKPFTQAAFHHELLKHLAGKVVDVLVLFSTGDAIALFNLGICYQNGFGVPKDDTQAVKWFRKAAEQGHAMAQKNLGRCYHWGRGVQLDYGEAVKWYRKAAEQNVAEAQFELGFYYLNAWNDEYSAQNVENNAEAIKWWRKAAEQNYTMAQMNLGGCYEYGQGVEKDYVEAVKWYRKVAQQNDALTSSAQTQLGDCYRRGRGVPKSIVESVRWYRIAAEQGESDAQFKLGFCYFHGKGVAQDYDEAAKWLRKSADHCDERAEWLLAKLNR